MNVLGSELKVGDILHVWWNTSSRGGDGTKDVITFLEDYNGPLAYLFNNGAKIAMFRFNRTGMTINNDDWYIIEDRT